MFTESELLIMSYAVDRIAAEANQGGLFFSYADANILCNKIHNILRAMRSKKVCDDQS
jgi:hypothetical protein